MFNRLRHNLEIAAPLLMVAVALAVATVASGATLRLMDVERPASAALALLGDGVDEFSLRMAQIQAVLQRLAEESDLLTAIAVGATGISVAAVLMHLWRSIRGSGDAVGFISHVADRTRLSAIPVHDWGTVRDARTGHPVPLVRLTLVSSAGRVVARTVADLRGRYGFGMPVHGVAGGASLQAEKDGYYPHHGGVLPLLANADHTADIIMDPAHLLPGGMRSWHIPASLGHVAFWVSVATVPLAATAAPNPVAVALGAGLAIALIGRIAGLSIHHS